MLHKALISPTSSGKALLMKWPRFSKRCSFAERLSATFCCSGHGRNGSSVDLKEKLEVLAVPRKKS